MKICSTCKINKDESLFHKRKSGKDELSYYCKSCASSRSKAWRDNNLEQVKAVSKAWTENNIDKVRNIKKEWAALNLDKVRAYSRINAKTYREGNPDKTNANTSKRRAQKLQAIPVWYEKDLVKKIFKMSIHWSKVLNIKCTVDLIVPLQSDIVCGLHCHANLQILEFSENISKGNRHWPDMPE